MGIKTAMLNDYMAALKVRIRKTVGKEQQDLKKKLRGCRRRRNWLMRMGQWPPKKRRPVDMREVVR